MSEIMPEGRSFFVVQKGFYEGTSANGRPIQENDDPALLRGARVPTKFGVCPYPDLRNGTMMNQSALISMHKSNLNNEVANSLAWINSQHLANTDASRITVGTAVYMATVAYVLPAYVNNRANTPYQIHDSTPDYIADTSKATKGLQRVTARLFRSLTDEPLPPSQLILDFALRAGLMTREVDGIMYGCAGLQEMIVEAADALFWRKAPDPEAAPLTQEVKDYEKLRLFSDAFFTGAQATALFQDQTHTALDNAIKARSLGTRNRLIEQFVEQKETYLDMMARLQKLMNVGLERDPAKASPPSVKDFVNNEYDGDFGVLNFVTEPHDYLRGFPIL